MCWVLLVPELVEFHFGRIHFRESVWVRNGMILGVDSPFFSTIVLSKNRLWVFDGFLNRRTPGKNGEGTPRMMQRMCQGAHGASHLRPADDWRLRCSRRGVWLGAGSQFAAWLWGDPGKSTAWLPLRLQVRNFTTSLAPLFIVD